MKTSATSLQAKILAINTCNEHSEIILNYELDQLQKFIGQSILKVDSSFKAKINHVKHETIKVSFLAFGFEWFKHTDYFFSSNYGKLTLNVKTCVNGGGADVNGVNKHCIYEHNTIDLFNIDSEGNLQPIEKQYFVNKQFNEADILESQAKIKQAAIEYNNILNSMPYEFRSVTSCERLIRN
jgi:hypothetical protein